MNYDIPERELMLSGHLACPGCGGALAMRLALKALGEKTIVVIPACCWSIISGAYPYSSLRTPLMNTAFETGGAAAAGIKAGLEMMGDTETTVMTWAGDGGTFDIGLQSLSGAVERNEDFIYACYDNEAYMNTGIQRSSATPWKAWTTTTLWPRTVSLMLPLQPWHTLRIWFASSRKLNPFVGPSLSISCLPAHRGGRASRPIPSSCHALQFRARSSHYTRWSVARSIVSMFGPRSMCQCVSTSGCRGASGT